jgi:hypothetical protein
MSVSANVIPHFVKAKTPEKLQARMLATALRRGTYIPFRDIRKSDDGFWYAWFDNEKNTNLLKEHNEVKNGISKK